MPTPNAKKIEKNLSTHRKRKYNLSSLKKQNLFLVCDINVIPGGQEICP